MINVHDLYIVCILYLCPHTIFSSHYDPQYFYEIKQQIINNYILYSTIIYGSYKYNIQAKI